MADGPYFTPDDIIGAVQRGLAIIQQHLNRPVEHVHGPACVAELERMMQFMSKIPAPVQATHAGPQPVDKRAN